MSKPREFWLDPYGLECCNPREDKALPYHGMILVREVLPTPEPRLKLPEFDLLKAEKFCTENDLTIYIEEDEAARGGYFGDVANPSVVEAMEYQHHLDQAHFTTTVTALMQVVEGLIKHAKPVATLDEDYQADKQDGVVFADFHSWWLRKSIERKANLKKALADAELKMKELDLKSDLFSKKLLGG